MLTFMQQIDCNLQACFYYSLSLAIFFHFISTSATLKEESRGGFCISKSHL